MRNNSLTLIALAITLMLFLPTKSFSQIIRTHGTTTELSSQLIFYYDQTLFDTLEPEDPDFRDNEIQVTNTNDTEGVWIHVQIFRSFDSNEDPTVVNAVICDERNFVDFLTPNDTHVYKLELENFPKNNGETESTVGESTSINVDDTVGFVVITPVVSESDLSAISFQHMMGNFNQAENNDYLVPAMGRDAVDFTTGEVIDDGTVLNGNTNGFVLIQPNELLFNFNNEEDPDGMDIIAIAFKDSYGEGGLQGYAVIPGDVNWNSFIFDFKEDPTSCGEKVIECFGTFGLNDTYQQVNREFVPDGVEDLLCEGSSTPEYDPNETISFEHNFFGWSRIFVSGIDGSENILGIAYHHLTSGAFAGAEWMYAR